MTLAPVFQDSGSSTTLEDSGISTFGARNPIPARNPEFRSSGSGAKPGSVAQNQIPAGNREFQTLANSAESASTPRNPIPPKSRKIGTLGFSEESGFGAQNRILLDPSRNAPRNPWSQACDFGSWGGAE